MLQNQTSDLAFHLVAERLNFFPLRPWCCQYESSYCECGHLGKDKIIQAFAFLEEDEIEISADKKIEVDKENGVMIATGNAFVKKGGTSLSADILTAFSCETTDGEMRIIQINADQNVIIKSDQGSAYANKGIYFVGNIYTIINFKLNS